MAILWITHDLGLVAGLAERVAVMYAGAIVESALTRDLFKRPRHPYTAGLLKAMPRVDAAHGERLTAIPGAPPDLRMEATGCAFAPRCSLVIERCWNERPALTQIAPGHEAACFRSDEL